MERGRGVTLHWIIIGIASGVLALIMKGSCPIILKDWVGGEYWI